MKLKYIKLIFVGLVGLCYTATAQEKEKALQLGAIVPDMNFNLMNSAREKTRLSDYKGKLVILDFWTTTCTGCIDQFPKLDSLQQAFGDRIKILLVNSLRGGIGENREKINNFFKRREARGKSFGLETAVEDTLAVQLFPHLMIPHYVWIDEQGRFIAATSSEQVAAQHIQSLLDGKPVKMRQKKDWMDFDIRKPLFTNDNGGEERNVIYKSTLTGYLDGLQLSSTGVVSEGKQSRLYMTNCSLRYMLGWLFNNRLRDNRYIVDKKYMHLFTLPGNSDDELWKRAQLYCYELITKPTTKDSLLLYMKADLARYFGFSVSLQKRHAKCMIITLKGNVKPTSDLQLNEKHENYVSSAFDLKTTLDYKSELPVIDETGYKDKFSVKLPENLKDVVTLKKMLNQQGFDIVEAQRELEMIVISKVE